MPTRAHTDHPFSRPDPPSKAQVQAYLEGRLPRDQEQAMERSMELDPLLRDAIEGLRIPGAATALESLHEQRPSPPGTHGRSALFLIGATLGMLTIGGIWLAASALLENDRNSSSQGTHATSAETIREQASYTPPLDPAEIATAMEQPETLRIGHVPEERPIPLGSTLAPVQREPGIAPLDPIRSKLPEAAHDPPRPARAKRSSRLLLFPHDLKLVHPDEQYPFDPGVDPTLLNVSAQYTDRRTQQANNEPPRTVRYTDYMDEALGQFSRNDHKACLKSLDFLLEQYPDDVNALFYAGLCSYNLALYEHARNFLHRAATHPIDSFNEEAVWYHALTLERLGEHRSAQEAFARIVADDGFYAERAAARLR